MKPRPAIGAVLFVLAAISCPAIGDVPATGKDAAALLEGVSSIAAPGVPGPLCVFGDQAIAVVTGDADKGARAPVVAAARLGAGRAVAFGHTDYFSAATLAAGDTGRLMVNAVRWAAGGAAAPEVAVYRQPALAAFLEKQGLRATALDAANWREKLKVFRVLCVHPAMLGDADLAAVKAFVEAGGGLVAADLGWGWLQLHPGKDLAADHPGNRLLAAAGIVWADGTLKPTAGGGFAAAAAPSPLTHAGLALEALLAQADHKASPTPDESAQASWTLMLAARSLPPDDALFLPRIRRLRQDRAATAVPTPDKPLKSDRVLDRLVLTLELEETKHLAPEKVRAHPAAAAFPGPVPADAPRVERAVPVNLAAPGWQSTGLYAAPGEVVTVTVPPALADRGLAVRIGAHSDRLWGLSSWGRAPEVCARAPMAGMTTRTASAFGGLIYIDVPDERRPAPAAPVTIRGAVEAPYYVLGRTDPAAWRDKVRRAPAPWAELATRKVILTVPSAAVRTLDDPEGLMKFWDTVLDSCAELAAMPLERRRPERYVADVQISAGYMHSGYPIMVLTDMPPVMVDKARLTANGHGGVWGLWHELGHNHQSRDWTFDGTGEVTENLFTLYVFDKACGRPQSAWNRVTGAGAMRSRKAYFAAGADFERWKKDPFLALQMYMQLQEAFGWDAYRKVFAEYRGLAPGERPKSDAQKRDQWLVRFSRAAGRNLGPFFQAWGVPTSEEARASVAGLPAWMPEGFPPK